VIGIARLLDKAVIFLLLSVLIFSTDDLFTPVIIFLTGISFSLACQAIDKKNIKTILFCIYMVLVIIKSDFVLMFPIVFYELSGSKNKILIILGALTGVIACVNFELDKVIIILSALVLSVVLQVKSQKYINLQQKLIDIRDEGTELNYILESKNRDLIDGQSYEIHLATLKERNRISREIHDNVGHLLTRSILQLGAMLAVNKNENDKIMLEGIKNTLDSAMTSIRESVHNLHDESIDLVNAINECINPIKEKYEINSIIDIDKNTEAKIKICMIMIVKEAVSNILKHSNCTKVEILLQEHPGFYKLLIHDNGTDIRENNFSGMGIVGMNERVERLNGIIRISNDNGFKIFVTIPKQKG